VILHRAIASDSMASGPWSGVTPIAGSTLTCRNWAHAIDVEIAVETRCADCAGARHARFGDGIHRDAMMGI